MGRKKLPKQSNTLDKYFISPNNKKTTEQVRDSSLVTIEDSRSTDLVAYGSENDKDIEEFHEFSEESCFQAHPLRHPLDIVKRSSLGLLV